MDQCILARLRRLGSFAAIAAVSVLLAACGGGESDESSAAPQETPTASGDGGGGDPAPKPLAEKTDVTIVSLAPIEAFAPPMVALAMSEFEKENLNVKIEQLADFQGALSQLGTGRVDMVVGGMSAGTFNAFASGVGIRYVAGVHQNVEENQEGLWVRKEFLTPDGKLDPTKVKGMRTAIAGGKGASSNLPVEQALSEVGAKFEDLDVKDLGFADQPLALEKGSIDAAYLLTPFWQQKAISECCALVTALPAWTSSVYLFTDEYLKDDRETAEAIMRAIMRTVRTYLQGDYHKDAKVMEAISKATGTPVEVLDSTPPLRFDPDMGFDLDVIGLQDLWIRLGGVLQYDEPIPENEIVDASVVDEVKAGK